MHFKIFTVALFTFLFSNGIAQNQKPLRIGIDGLTHTHVHWLLGRAHDGDLEIVGIAEPDRDLAERYLKQYKLPLNLLYPSLTAMLDRTKPEAVAAFNSIYEHLETVKTCAPRKIHVMVEKPLAVSLDHAKQMKALADENNIHLLVNYETTWYGSNYFTYDKVTDQSIRKVVVHDGHQGPKEIGVNTEFLKWLTDPVQNGGGALMDFGCYGANLITWLMKGQRPLTVSATTQQIKPDLYPKVEDEATIVITYPKTQGIIQASWNWPYNRKDMEVYTTSAYFIADRNGVKVKPSPDEPENFVAIPARPKPYNDPFAYFAGVIHGEITVSESDLSSLRNNMIVMEILEAAKQSAEEGKVIFLKP
jgi:predicted dehydrogenase